MKICYCLRSHDWWDIHYKSVKEPIRRGHELLKKQKSVSWPTVGCVCKIDCGFQTMTGILFLKLSLNISRQINSISRGGNYMQDSLVTTLIQFVMWNNYGTVSLPVLLLFWDSYSYKHFLLIPSNLKISQLICLDQVSRKLWYMKWVLLVCHVCRTYRIVKFVPFQSVPTTPHPFLTCPCVTFWTPLEDTAPEPFWGSLNIPESFLLFGTGLETSLLSFVSP